ncbi:hypothetical protein DRQ00_04045 [candidate division KSB1 bacterium]|nr:MAG: hypothetical protein DRQ00_04045 [candidate division KSB1 bacterium]
MSWELIVTLSNPVSLKNSWKGFNISKPTGELSTYHLQNQLVSKRSRMSRNILVVEDNIDQAELLSKALKKHHSEFEIFIAHCGKNCLELCRTHRFQAILLDYKLPDYSGIEVLQELHRLGIKCPVIVVTGQGDEKIAVQAMKHGAYDYVIKEPNYIKTLPRLVVNAIQRYQLEQKLHEKDIFLENLVENADAIIFSLDKNLNFIFVNSRIQELGYNPDELIGRKFSSILAQKINPDNLIAMVKNPQKRNYELDFKDLKGKTRNMLVSFTKLKNKEDIGDQFLGISKDITEKKKLELQILESKIKLQTLFDSITDSIVVVDHDFNIVMANRKIADLHGITPNKLIGRKCYEVYFNSNKPCENCVVQRTWNSKSSEFFEIARGENVYQYWSYPMYNLKGEMEYVIEYCRDVTEQKKLERHLIQSEKLATIGLLASGIAHELRNPLNIIETARYYLEDVFSPQNEDIRSKLTIIRRNVQRASNIINNLLEFSRHSAQDREEIDVNQLIDKTLALIEKDLTSQNISVEKRYHDVPPAFLGLDSLKQVFLNIIINAIQAMPEGGKLQIETYSPEKGWVEVKFTDTGHGIPSEHLPLIFTPFFTTKKVGQGTGLGMYVSHSIVRREGGDIMIESQQGRGTTFTVRLPAEENGLMKQHSSTQQAK